MMKSLELNMVLLLGVGLCGCGKVSPKAIDDGPGVTASNTSGTGSAGYTGSYLHSPSGWRNTVFFYVDDGAPELIVEAALNAIRTWNNAVGKDVLSYEGRKDATPQVDLYNTLKDDQTVIYYDSDWRDNTGKADGVLATTIWENDDNDANYIARADIILNAQVFLFQDSTKDPIDESRIYDIADTESVLTHEFGHLLGLDHVPDSADAKSIMHAKTLVGLDIYDRELSDGDEKRIRSIYDKSP